MFNIKNIVISLILFIVTAFFLYNFTGKEKELNRKLEKAQKEILAKDKQIKIADGKYSKLINTFKTQSDLNKQLKEENSLLYGTIQSRKEKVLSVTNADVTFKKKSGTITPLTPISDSTMSFTSYYPEKKDYFIKYEGNVNVKDKTVKESWEFTKFKLSVIMTEREDGLWDGYVDVPKFAEVSGIKINSLPPVEYSPKTTKEKFFSLYGGGGYIFNLNDAKNKNIYVQGGIGVKGKAILLGGLSTDKSVSAGLLLKF